MKKKAYTKQELSDLVDQFRHPGKGIPEEIYAKVVILEVPLHTHPDASRMIIQMYEGRVALQLDEAKKIHLVIAGKKSYSNFTLPRRLEWEPLYLEEPRRGITGNYTSRKNHYMQDVIITPYHPVRR